MDDICFGFHLRDMRGLELFGWDMLNAGLAPLDPFAPGEERDVTLRFCANLSANHYFLSVTLAHWDKTKEDVRFDAHDLIVKPTPHIFTASLVNLDVAFERHYAAPDLDVTVIPLGPFVHEAGLLWACEVPGAGIECDDLSDATRSSVALFEDDRRLGPAHADHEMIRRGGRGRYSHWQDSLFFSTSDGSDPNTNGRRYVAVVPK